MINFIKRIFNKETTRIRYRLSVENKKHGKLYYSKEGVWTHRKSKSELRKNKDFRDIKTGFLSANLCVEEVIVRK